MVKKKPVGSKVKVHGVSRISENDDLDQLMCTKTQFRRLSCNWKIGWNWSNSCTKTRMRMDLFSVNRVGGQKGIVYSNPKK